MIAVIASSRVLDPVIEQAHDAGDTEVWAPAGLPAFLGRIPGRIGAFVARRSIAADVRGPISIAQAGLRAWAGDKTDRSYQAEFLLRVAIDRWSAAQVRRRKPKLVIASSLAARETFAAARELGARCVLAIDLPLLRVLHRDLDRAAAVWPERSFLRRFRAPSWAIARQEVERVLADLILVRGPYARASCLADGIPASRIAALPLPPPPSIEADGSKRVRLAGLAAARHGIDTALAATRLLGLTLVVRAGDGTEPSDLLQQPGVVSDSGPVGAIICPAICETYPPELRATGIPVIASPMASVDGRGPDPFDARALAAAIEQSSPSRHSEPSSIAPLLALLA